MIRELLRTFGSLTVGALALAPLALPQDKAKVGDTVAHTFEKPLVNGLGVKSLADLHGTPVLVEFWGTM